MERSGIIGLVLFFVLVVFLAGNWPTDKPEANFMIWLACYCAAVYIDIILHLRSEAKTRHVTAACPSKHGF